MIITVTYKGKPHGKPINDLYESDLLWFIRNELTQGREIHITPEEGDLYYGGKK